MLVKMIKKIFLNLLGLIVSLSLIVLIAGLGYICLYSLGIVLSGISIPVTVK